MSRVRGEIQSTLDQRFKEGLVFVWEGKVPIEEGNDVVIGGDLQTRYSSGYGFHKHCYTAR